MLHPHLHGDGVTRCIDVTIAYARNVPFYFIVFPIVDLLVVVVLSIDYLTRLILISPIMWHS